MEKRGGSGPGPHPGVLEEEAPAGELEKAVGVRQKTGKSL